MVRLLRKNTKWSLLRWVIVILCALVLLPALAFAVWIPYVLHADRQTERNTRRICNALEAYAKDHGAFPGDIQALVQQGYLQRFPTNPYAFRPMRNLPLKPKPANGELVFIKPSGGDYTYVHSHEIGRIPRTRNKDWFVLDSYYRYPRGLTSLTKDYGWWCQIDQMSVCMSCIGLLTAANGIKIDCTSITDSLNTYHRGEIGP
jgi:hypothetical protein